MSEVKNCFSCKHIDTKFPDGKYGMPDISKPLIYSCKNGNDKEIRDYVAKYGSSKGGEVIPNMTCHQYSDHILRLQGMSNDIGKMLDVLKDAKKGKINH